MTKRDFRRVDVAETRRMRRCWRERSFWEYFISQLALFFCVIESYDPLFFSIIHFVLNRFLDQSLRFVLTLVFVFLWSTLRCSSGIIDIVCIKVIRIHCFSFLTFYVWILDMLYWRTKINTFLLQETQKIK